MARKGHDVYCIASGFDYDYAGRIYVKRGPDVEGVRNYIIFNARNIAPGFYNYSDPLSDVNEPIIEDVFRKLLDQIRPTVVLPILIEMDD